MKATLQLHIQSIHLGEKFPCPQCEYKSTQKSSLRTHIKSIHEGQKIPCTYCEYKGTAKHHLKIHIRSVHEGQRFICSICYLPFKSLRMHMKDMHEKGQEHPCPISKHQTIEVCENTKK